MRAAIYTRISLDRDGTSEAPERQEQDCRRLIESRGWTVAEVYSDRDLSAYSGKRRPEYERLLDDVKTDSFDAIVVYKLDRLSRSVKDFSNTLDLLLTHDVDFISTTEPFDTTSGIGRAMLQISAVFAELESSTISLRMKSRNAHSAEKGRLHPGGRRVFGLNPNGTENVTEANELRHAVSSYLNGSSLNDICRDLNARGITTTAGGAWTSTVLNRLFRNPTIAGYRTHNGAVHEGTFATVVDRDTFAKIQGQMIDGRKYKKRIEVDQYLLTGFIHTPDGRKMFHLTMKDSNGKTRDVYKSAQELEKNRSERLPTLSCPMTAVDDVVASKALARIAMSALEDESVPVDTAALSQQLNDAKTSLASLIDDHYRRRIIPADVFHEVRLALENEITGLENEIAKAQQVKPELPTQPAALLAWWEAATILERRELLKAMISRVIIHPASTKGKFDPERVEVVWS